MLFLSAQHGILRRERLVISESANEVRNGLFSVSKSKNRRCELREEYFAGKVARPVGDGCA